MSRPELQEIISYILSTSPTSGRTSPAPQEELHFLLIEAGTKPEDSVPPGYG